MRLIWLVGAGLVACATAQAQEAVGRETTKSLRATVQKWTEVMRETQGAQERWKQDKQVLQDTKSSLEIEVEQLKAEIKAAEERIAETDAASADKLALKQMHEKAREAFRAGLDAVEAEVSAVIPLLPAELAENPKMQVAIESHRKFSASTEKESLSLNKRLDAMLTILAEAERFQQAIQVYGGRVRELSGEQRLLDVVYFGLALGYGVDQDGTIAFQLSPSPEGWVERKLEAEDALAVRELMNVAQKSGEVRLVDVPMTIGE